MSVVLRPPPRRKPKPTRNERRRTAYAQDDDVRETLKKQSRQRYRKQNQVELDSCLRSLAFYESLAEAKRVYLPSGTVKTMQVLGFQQTADCLQKIYQTVWRWKENGMIPPPILLTESRGVGVYHADEVRVLIEEIGRHEQAMAYYRANHREVRERIFSRIINLRNHWS